MREKRAEEKREEVQRCMMGEEDAATRKRQRPSMDAPPSEPQSKKQRTSTDLADERRLNVMKEMLYTCEAGELLLRLQQEHGSGNVFGDAVLKQVFGCGKKTLGPYRRLIVNDVFGAWGLVLDALQHARTKAEGSR